MYYEVLCVSQQKKTAKAATRRDEQDFFRKIGTATCNCTVDSWPYQLADVEFADRVLPHVLRPDVQGLGEWWVGRNWEVKGEFGSKCWHFRTGRSGADEALLHSKMTAEEQVKSVPLEQIGERPPRPSQGQAWWINHSTRLSNRRYCRVAPQTNEMRCGVLAWRGCWSGFLQKTRQTEQTAWRHLVRPTTTRQQGRLLLGV